MKLIFNKLITTDNKVNVSFDKGNIFTSYNNSVALTDGIPFTMEDCNNDLSNIIVKGKVKSLTDIDVIKQIDESDDSSETINVGIKADYYRGAYACINNVDFSDYTGEYTIYIGNQNINDSIYINDLKNNDILSVDFNNGLSLPVGKINYTYDYANPEIHYFSLDTVAYSASSYHYVCINSTDESIFPYTADVFDSNYNTVMSLNEADIGIEESRPILDVGNITDNFYEIDNNGIVTNILWIHDSTKDNDLTDNEE